MRLVRRDETKLPNCPKNMKSEDRNWLQAPALGDREDIKLPNRPKPLNHWDQTSLPAQVLALALAVGETWLPNHREFLKG